MDEYGKASLYEWLQIDLVPLLQKQILYSATLLANKVVVLGDHGVVTGYPFSQQEHADLALFDQPLQVAVDRAEADAWEPFAHPLIDLISTRVGVVPV